MSLLYKNAADQKLFVEIKQKDNKITIEFSSDCGKLGMIEPLDGYQLTPLRLLQILQDRDDYKEQEIDY